MKKINKIIITLLMVMVFMTALVACNDKDTHKGEFTYEINNADDLADVANMLGADYDKGTFILNTDLNLSDDNWTAIGDSVINSFRGTFNGNGHTITYKINIAEPEERDTTSKLVDEKFYGLFGVIHNATISNLNLSVNIEVPSDASSIYLGGLCGFASGTCNVSNVNVSGSIYTTMGDICKTTISEDGSEIKERERYEMAEYVGGLIGYVKGEATIANVNSSVFINVGAYERYGYKAALNDVFAGGVVGSMRTVDLSSLRANTNYCSAKALSFTGSITATGNLVNVGGIFGSAYRIYDGEKWTVNSNNISAYAFKRSRVGGIAGLLDRVTLKKASSNVNKINAEIFSSSTSRSFNVGGLVGYLANFSYVENVISNAQKITVSTYTNNYTGGLVGMLHFSTIKNAVADGALYYDNKSILDNTDISYASSGNRNNAYYIYNGGAVGRMYGASTLDNLSTKFTAYQGVVGELANAIEIVSVKVGEGESVENAYTAWLQSTVYDSTQLTASKEGGVEEGEQKYRIIHNYNVASNNYTYVKTNSKCFNDLADNPVAADERMVKVGTGVDDTISYDALYSAISSAINN